MGGGEVKTAKVICWFLSPREQDTAPFLDQNLKGKKETFASPVATWCRTDANVAQAGSDAAVSERRRLCKPRTRLGGARLMRTALGTGTGRRLSLGVHTGV